MEIYGFMFINLLAFIILAIPIILLIKVLRKENVSNNSKIFWVIMLIIFNYLGVVMYIFIPNKNVFK